MARKNTNDDLVFGEQTRKIHPKARMVSNGSKEVNTIRAGCSAAVRVSDALAEAPVGQDPLSRTALGANRGSLERKIPGEVRANVFIRMNATERPQDAGRAPEGIDARAPRRGNLIAAEIPLDRLEVLAADPRVAYVELGEALSPPAPAVEENHPPKPARRKFAQADRHQDGKDILIGIIDVQGFDFAHEDFLDAKGNTRFLRIWDQGEQNGRPHPAKFTYGAEIDGTMMNAAIRDGAKLGAPATSVEKQSQMAVRSHGTHVASIAAGNTGVCSNARIVGVLISIPEEERARRKSFYDSTCVAHAIDYILDIASDPKHRFKGVAINISLGTNGHAHDASSAVSRWIDHAMATPGRCVTVAAGNSGQESARYEGDIGWIMGRIHTSGAVAAKDLHQDIEWIVYGNGVVDVSENELELWYGAQDRFAVQLRTPDGKWIGPIEPQEFIENRRLPDGSMVSIYNELYHPANGSNYISIYLSPFLHAEGVVGVPNGNWTVRLIGRDVRDGRYHGWIERDDPRRFAKTGDGEHWAFPSFFSSASNVDDSSVSSLACGRFIISVANLDEVADRINITSSQGPTRDGRFKPDIAAPGTGVTAAKGFSPDPDDAWVKMSGTSMAAPFVCGVAGLMLAIEPTLTSSQIEGIMQRTAQPLPGATFAWKNDAGFGRIDADRCLAEAAQVHARKDKTK
jgi:subtilisin family serine protease